LQFQGAGGGAVFIQGLERLNISDGVQMIQNVANWGGALRLNNFADFPTKSIVLRNITLTRNVAAYGGAVSLTSLESVVIVENVLMLNNSATISGGAVMTDGSVVKLYCTRSIRTAQKRVRCQLYLCSLRCTPCAQSNLWIVSVLQDVNFLRKRLLCRCGGTRIEFNRAVERGGGLYVLTTSNSYAKRTGLWIRRVTVSHNEANRGGGIFASFAEIELPDGSDGVFLLRKNVAGDLKRGGGGGGMVLENSHLVRRPVQFGTQCRA